MDKISPGQISLPGVSGKERPLPRAVPDVVPAKAGIRVVCKYARTGISSIRYANITPYGVTTNGTGDLSNLATSEAPSRLFFGFCREVVES
jgi:hypothetical protein